MKHPRRVGRGSLQTVWARFAEEIGADFLEESDDHGPTVRTTMGDWIVTMDTVGLESGGESTRIRAPFAARDELRFRVYRGNWLTELQKLLGLQDIEVGHPFFDRDFVIQGAPVATIQEIIGDNVLIDLIRRQPQFDLAIQDTEGWTGPKFPDGVDVLRFSVPGVVVTPYHLHGLFDVFRRLLERVTYLGPHAETDPRLQVQRLRVPGAEIRSRGRLLYDGRRIQLEAAERLADLGDPSATPALIFALNHGTPALQARAAYALGEIGDERAIDPLVEKLSAGGSVQRRPVADWAREALHSLGEGELAIAVRKALLHGNVASLLGRVNDRREPVVKAFVEGLRGATCENAARALVEMAAVEALPSLHDRLRVYGKRSGRGLVIQGAITALQSRAALPKPAEAPPSRRETLPKAARPPGPDTRDLPRTAREPGPGPSGEAEE